MRLSSIALANLKVRKSRTIFLGLGIGVGVATIVALFAINAAMRRQLSTQFQEMGVRVLIAPYTEKLSLAYNGVTIASGVTYESVELAPQAVAGLESDYLREKTRVLAPKLLQPVDLGGRPGLAVGVRFDAEKRLKPWWSLAGREPSGGGELVLGSEAARGAAKGPGDTILVNGKPWLISGVLKETGREEDRLAFLDLIEAQRAFQRAGAVSFVEASLPVPAGGAGGKNSLQEEIQGIKARLPGAQVTQVKNQSEARQEVVDRFAQFSRLVGGIVLLIGVLIVFITTTSSVNERTREIGILRALGFRRTHVLRIILAEAGLVSSLGGLFGYLLGMATAVLAAPLVAQIGVAVGWDPLLGAGVILLSTVVGLLSGLYPALRASNLDPVEALRFIE